MKSRTPNLITALVLGGFAAPLTTNLSAATTFTIGFDTDGNTEGFTGTNINGLTASSGFLTGTASNGDPQLISATDTSTSTPIFSKPEEETWTTVAFRVRETDETLTTVTPFDAAGLVIILNSVNNGLNNPTRTIISSGFTAVDSGDGFFTVSVDVSGYTQNDIRYFRFDPIGAGDASGNQFEVDSVQINAVPEPSAVALGALGMLGLLRRRR